MEPVDVVLHLYHVTEEMKGNWVMGGGEERMSVDHRILSKEIRVAF